MAEEEKAKKEEKKNLICFASISSETKINTQSIDHPLN